MLQTLHGKLSAVLLALLCLIGILYMVLTVFTTRQYLQEVNQKLNRHLAADLTAHLAAKGLLRPQPQVQARARVEISELMAINPSVEVYLLDSQGRILTYSAPPAEVKRQQVSLTPVLRFLGNAAPLPILGDDPRDFTRQKIFSAASFSSRGQRGYVYVILGGEDYDSVAGLLGRSVILRSSLGMAAGILVFVLAAGLLLFRGLTRRLRQLAAAVGQFPAGGLAAPDVAAPRDEIDRLSLLYQQVSERIQAQVQEQTRADSLRRELVGNVSHDLRTPLAALQGYLETLLMKEEILTPEERHGYLLTALRHCERLALLVAELFELAQLDSRETPVHAEPFALGELVQDMAQQFRLAAEKKNVHLQPRFAEDLPPVSADIGLIARVLENLLDNALRYTPEGGLITISLLPENEKIAVQVQDTGVGIRPEDLPHIFERFYRVQNPAALPGGAGLGLAIARRILELHGSPLEVDSAPDQGTTFRFVLLVSVTES